MLYLSLWAYQTIVKTATGFSPFQHNHEAEAVTLFECEIPSLKLVVQILPDTYALEEWLIFLENIDEQCQDAATTNEAHKKRVKNQYDKFV